MTTVTLYPITAYYTTPLIWHFTPLIGFDLACAPQVVHPETLRKWRWHLEDLAFLEFWNVCPYQFSRLMPILYSTPKKTNVEDDMPSSGGSSGEGGPCFSEEFQKHLNSETF